MVWSSAQQNTADAGQQQQNPYQQQFPQQQQQQQQQGMHNANGGAAGGPGVPAAAEYTLQGVMRFLQTEWHKHERDRNNWEIERAEMKARIAKLEGDSRAEKRLQQLYQNRIDILENALKQERLRKGGEAGNEDAQKLSEKVAQALEEASAASHRAETTRKSSRQYLEKCLQEITYLLTPPSHPAPAPTHPIPHGSHIDPPYPAALYAQEPPNRPPQQPLPQQPSYALQHQGNPFPSYKAPQRVQRTEQPPIAIPEGHDVHGMSNIPVSLRAKDTNPFTLTEDSHNRAPSASTSDIGDDEWDFPKTDISESSNGDEQHEPEPRRTGSRRGSGSPLIRKRLSLTNANSQDLDSGNFKVKFAMRGHLDVIRAVCFTGGGTLEEPEIATTGDDAVIKRWYIPGGKYGLSLGQNSGDVDVTSHFTHRGHDGMVTSLTAAPVPGGGDGWVISGGLDSTVKVWVNGKVDAKATLVGHTDVVWTVCVLPRSSVSTSTTPDSPSSGSDSSRPSSSSSSSSTSLTTERILLASGSADGTVKIWAITPPPSLPRRSSSASIRNLHTQDPISVPFNYSLLNTITRPDLSPSPTSITPLSPVTGESFLVAYNDASVVLYDTTTGEELTEMQSKETYDGTGKTGVNCVVATMEVMDMGNNTGKEGEKMIAGATGSGVVITGHEDRFVRIFDANSGQCTYTMLAHPASIASLALSPDGRELVSGGHDASLRFWSMEKRSCTQEITAHRLYRGEGVCAVAWSQDGRWVVSAGGDGVVKVYCR
ncbi:WD40 repeat-like protein [Ascodesmis nigricans]|uniref:WD40 repeat-like protein n=1 Tax=Ascodesmis nigricans TaxID=341454 RepID=A0A4S2N5M5_9PEZI|nr:WD40 repeat-like protein [Ascodesmis nigricans]